MPKEKLTLSVDKEVVDKAKKLGINISDITEKVLTGYTAAEKPNNDLYKAYTQLFDSIIPLLQEFDCSIKIAEGIDTVHSTDNEGKKSDYEMPFNFYLCSDGSLYNEEFDSILDGIDEIPRPFFFSPERILANVVASLSNSKEKREEQIKEIQMAKRIIDAMSESLLKKHTIEEKQDKTKT